MGRTEAARGSGFGTETRRDGGCEVGGGEKDGEGGHGVRDGGGDSGAHGVPAGSERSEGKGKRDVE